MPLTKFKLSSIADGGISTAKLADGAVTLTKTDNLFENTTFTGDDGIVVPKGTTAQRPVSPVIGEVRFNTTLNQLEQYTTEGWQGISPPPLVSAVTPTTYDGDAGTAFTITGSNFDTSPSVKFVTNAGTQYTAASVTRNSGNEIVATTPQDFAIADEPLDIIVINGSGLTASLEDAIDCGGVPTWNTTSPITSGKEKHSYSTTLSATDPDGGAVTYDVASGSSLPTGLSLNSSTGVLSGTLPDVSADTSYNFSIDAEDVGGNTTTKSLSFTSLRGDPYWKNTLMYMKSTGANGATTHGSAFNSIDSTSNTTWTGQNHATLTTSSPFGTGWSGYFDQYEGQYIEVNNTSGDFNFGSNDWTMEGWFFATSYKDAFPRPFGFALEGTSSGSGIGLFWGNTKDGGTIYIRSNETGDASRTINAPVNEWYHLALVRDGGSIYLYKNGVQVGGSVTISGSITTGTRFRIGASNSNTANEYWDGFISNVRVLNGTCAYPGGTTFTPPTADFASGDTTNEVLIALNTNRWDYDATESGNNTITHHENGGSSTGVQTFQFNPFGSERVEGQGSIQISENSTDYVTAPDTDGINVGSGDFTIDGWVYPMAQANPGSNGPIFNQSGSGASDGDNSFYVACEGLGAGIWITDGTNWDYSAIWQPGISISHQWNHVVFQRSGTELSTWVNGVKRATTTIPSGFTIFNSTKTIELGRQNDDAATTSARLADLRFVKGTALYSGSTYTIPSSPSTAVTGTAFLLNQCDPAVKDLCGNTAMDVYNNSASSTSQVKYGTSSVSFDGTSDFIVITHDEGNNHQLFNWMTTDDNIGGSGTIEAWIYPTSYNSSPSQDYLGSCIISRGDTYFAFSIHPTGYLSFYTYSGGQNYHTATSNPISGLLNQWNHVAATFVNGTIRLWVNGVQSGSMSMTGIKDDTGTDRSGSYGDKFFIGSIPGQPEADWTGYIDEVRITAGVARYWDSNFTPPTRTDSEFQS